MAEVKILGYRTTRRSPLSSRADILVQPDDGQVEVIRDKCICGWCCKTSKLQKALLSELLKKHPEMVVRSRKDPSHKYPASTQGKWFMIEDTE